MGEPDVYIFYNQNEHVEPDVYIFYNQNEYGGAWTMLILQSEWTWGAWCIHFLQSEADFGFEFASIWELPGEGPEARPLVVGGGGGIGASKRLRNDSGSGAGKIAYWMVSTVFLQ